MDAPYSFVSIFSRVGGWTPAVPLVLLLGVGSVVLNETIREQRLKKEGVVAEAIVVRKEKSRSSINFLNIQATPFGIDYAFLTPDGREFAGSTSVSEERFNELREGSEIQIVYWRDDPELNDIAGTSSNGASDVFVIALLALVQGWLAARKVQFARRAMAARDRGELLSAKVTGHHRHIYENDQGSLKVSYLLKRKDDRLDWKVADGPSGSTLNLSLNELLDHPVGADLTVYRHPTKRDFLISAAEVGLRPGLAAKAAEKMQ